MLFYVHNNQDVLFVYNSYDVETGSYNDLTFTTAFQTSLFLRVVFWRDFSV